MKDEVKLNPLGIHDIYSHLMRMASINTINANSSQPIFSHEDQSVFHHILAAMY